uniref:CD1c molecule n=1 Tax=Saimiri boliviensis boliviensis TaxID=39432 RepID=A0A2K6SIV2_SAIBB
APEHVSFHVIQTASFANQSWAQCQGSGWLDDLQTHGWERESNTITFLHTWAKGNFSNEEFLYLNRLFRVYSIRLVQDIQAHASQYPTELRPEAWLSSRPSLGSGRLLLACHVSGFYPKPVWVTWMRNEQEQLGTEYGDILPNADGTWYLQVTLDVASEEAAGLSCRVRHSSLGGQDIILYWGHHFSMNWTALVVVMVTLVILIVLVLWFKKHWSYQDIL